MSRGLGVFELLREAIPEWGAVPIALLTQLGDVWFLALVLTVLYWRQTRDRDEIAIVAGVTLAGIGLYNGLKAIFGLPRPTHTLLEPTLLPEYVQPLYVATATAGGYGFPSGHAVNVTVVYLGLASVLSVWTTRRRFAAAGAIIAVVSFTRVALGVHYVVDVVAGIAVGLALLLAARAILELDVTDRTTVAFALGIGCCTFFLVADDWAADAVVLLAAALGAFGGWQLVVLARRLRVSPSLSSAVRPLVFRGGAAVVATVSLAALSVASDAAMPTVPAVLVGVVTGLVVVGPVVRRAIPARTLYSRIRRLTD